VSDESNENEDKRSDAEREAAASSFLTQDSTPDRGEDDDAAQALAAFMKAEPEQPIETEMDPAPPMEASDFLTREESPSPDAEPPVSARKTPKPKTEVPVEDVEDEYEEEKPLVKEPPDDGIRRRWYAVHCHSGQEATVQKSLESKAEQEGLSNLMTNVLVPMERVAEFKSGEKKVSQRKFFPGYILVQLPEHPERDANLWHLIKDTPGVTGFIGSRTEPVPLDDDEVAALLDEIRGERERPRAKVNFAVGERVKIIDGAFANFTGNVNEINPERGRLKVMIEIFERQTAVEVEFWQVEKL
jgi:transcription termination/antitermination protein NusG